MQIFSISPDRYVEPQSFLKHIHQLRAGVFGERSEWDVTISGAGYRSSVADDNGHLVRSAA